MGHEDGGPQPSVQQPDTARPTALQSFAEAARELGEVTSARLWLHDSVTSTYRVAAWACTGARRPEPVAEDTQPLKDARESQTPRLTQAEGPDATTHALAAPLAFAGGHGVGVVHLKATSPDEARALQIAAAHSQAMAASLQTMLARQRLATAEVMIESVEELARLVDPNLVNNTLLNRALALTGAHTGSVMLADDSGTKLEIAAAKGLPDNVVRSSSVQAGEGAAGWVFATRQPVVIEDLRSAGPRARRHGVCSAMSVPIGDGDGVLGVLNVGSRTYPARSMREQLDALTRLARVGAAALRSARAHCGSRALHFDTLKALALALESKDPFAQGATGRVVELTGMLGDRLALEPHEAEALKIASLLHDIGMDAAGSVSTSNRPLSTVERALLKMHPMIAADVLKQIPALSEVTPIVYHHHEHYDGAGYMAGLAGESIPVGARILAVADAYVAMTSDRPYRRALEPAQALAELKAKSGTQFDPAVISAITELAETGALETLIQTG